MHRRRKRGHLRGLLLLAFSSVLIGAGVMLLWVSTWKLPDIAAFPERKVEQSTKLFDRTGEILLFDLNSGKKRTIIPYTEISRHMKNATVAIEDDSFFQHRGVRPLAFLRAALKNLRTGSFSQGGSTITQQVVKNSLLTGEKKISRKLKEWVLAWKMEQYMDKETILALYLNEAPYGGTLYGIEEAAQAFFGKEASELSIAESAYLAALPNAPTYFSPYGNHRDKLEERKDLVLSRMRGLGFITKTEYETATAEKVSFLPPTETGIRAPHFVFFVRQYLEERYGRRALEEEGLRVITTLDMELQQKAEKIVKDYALKNKETFDAENAALVALDPKTGQILAMVGSRDYFDADIDGNFNASLGLRQPGSAFKPFVYAQALRKGFTPETMVFDVPTEFSTECNPDGTPIKPEDEKKCYKPENYDGKYHGPVSFRDALAQSINVPSIQVLYLAGLTDSLRLAKDLGLSTLADTDRYGLTLVLGGGEVMLLELVSAYGVFAAEGERYPPAALLRVTDKDGRILEMFEARSARVLEKEIAETITDILADNRARTPAFSATSPLYFPGRAVAAKTGTTNDFRDAWIVGYTPSIVVGAWAGNNDNRPMKKIAAFIVAPLWHEFMKEALQTVPEEDFSKPPEKDLSALPPILRGIWQGGRTYFVDKLSGKRATEYTPPELREERAIREVHSTLYWIDKDAPLLPRTTPPESDSQFTHWEYAVRTWAAEQNLADQTEADIPTALDDIHKPEFSPKLSFLEPATGIVSSRTARIVTRVTASSHFPITKINFFVNNLFVGSATKAPWTVSVSLADLDNLAATNELKAVAYDVVQNRGEATVQFKVEQ